MPCDVWIAFCYFDYMLQVLRFCRIYQGNVRLFLFRFRSVFHTLEVTVTKILWTYMKDTRIISSLDQM